MKFSARLSFYAGVLTLLRLEAASALRKTWRLSWNLDDDANWSGGSVHCPGQLLKFPQQLDYSTYLSSSLRVGKLSLPQSGEIVFGEAGSLELGSGWARPSRCGAQPAAVTWSHSGGDEWWDARAWTIPAELQANASAVPDLSRVPCTTDTAVLRPYPKYLSPIRITPPMVKVDSVEVAGQRLTTSGVLEYAAHNASGQLTRSPPLGGALLYAEQDPLCSSATDCVCAAKGQARLLKHAVCGRRNLRCPVPLCDSPVAMQDFCCPQCGVDFTLPSSFRGNSRRLESLLGSIDTSESAKGVARYVGLMTDLRYHVYIVPRDEKGDYAAVADMITEILDKAISGPLEVAAAGVSAYQQQEAGRGVTNGVVSAFVIIVLLAALLYFIHRKGYTRTLLRSESPVNFQFRRMSMVAIRRLSRIPLHADVLSSRHASDAPGSRTPDLASPVPSYSVQSGGLRFMNPVFSKSTASLAAMPIDPEGGMGDVQEDASPGTDEVENPMYGAFMHMTPDEKQAYDESNSDSAQGPPKPPRLDDKGQGVIRFSQLGTIDEDEQSNEENAEIVTDSAGTTEPNRAAGASSQLISTSEEAPSVAASGEIEAGLPGIQSAKDMTECNDDDTKIVIEVHQAPNEQMEFMGRADFGDTEAIEIPELPSLEQLNAKKDDGAAGINFGFEDDD